LGKWELGIGNDTGCLRRKDVIFVMQADELNNPPLERGKILSFNFINATKCESSPTNELLIMKYGWLVSIEIIIIGQNYNC